MPRRRQRRIRRARQSGNRSSAAKAALEGLGFTNVNDFGGISNWKGELAVR